MARLRIFHFYNKEHSRGGATVAFDLNKHAWAIALCCEKDGFCRSDGVDRATNKLVHMITQSPRRRFKHRGEFDDTMTKEQMFIMAQQLVIDAARKVGNQVVLKAASTT